MDQRKAIPLVVVGILLLIVAVTSFHIVPPGNRGVRVTLGRVAAEPLGEGAALKWPFGISEIVDISVQQQTVQGEADCFSKDLQTIKIAYAVLYRLNVNSVVELYQQYKGDPYVSLIAPRLQEAIKQVASGYQAEELVQQRSQVRERTLQALRQAVGDKVEVVDVNVMNIDLTDELERAIENKMVQQQQALAKNFELEREVKQAEITIVQAKAEAEAVKIKGEALASAPTVVQLEIAKKWDGRAPQTLVVGPGASGADVVFPIAGIGSGTATAGTPVQPVTPARSAR